MSFPDALGFVPPCDSAGRPTRKAVAGMHRLTISARSGTNPAAAALGSLVPARVLSNPEPGQDVAAVQCRSLTTQSIQAYPRSAKWPPVWRPLIGRARLLAHARIGQPACG